MDPTRILVVEDENIVAMGIENRLRKLGYMVAGRAASGEEAVRMAEETLPDLVLMDIKLQGEIDGVEAAEEIRLRYGLPVVYLTSYADEHTLQRAKITEPFGYVLKPFEDKDLLTTIEMAIYKHRTERKLKESEQWLSTTLRSIGEGVVVTDNRGIITFINPVAETLIGWSQGEAAGREISTVIRVMPGPVPDFGAAEMGAAGREGPAEVLPHYALLETRDGRRIPVDSLTTPIRDNSGRVAGEVIVLRDMTERQHADDKLSRILTELEYQKGFFRALFEASPNGVLVADDENRLRAVNAYMERILGFPGEGVIGLPVGEALRCIHAHEDEKGCGFSDGCQNCQIRRAVQSALTGGHLYRNRAEVRWDSGKKALELILLVSSASFEYGGRRMAVIVLEDITELASLRQKLKKEQTFEGMVGCDIRMMELFDAIRDVADTSVPVLIEGESGTGKELVASAIHGQSRRTGKPFVPVNCGALPDTLLETELFGHVKGAFTGAVRDKKGRFELADGGTIFLDEVGDLSPAMQVKLLRVLQEGTFERVGGERTVKVDVRVISATNRNLMDEVRAGRFREDLYYRLCVMPINLPPLRERSKDIPILADKFLQQACAEAGRDPATLSSRALHLMMGYHWPGNVRELQNALQFAMIKSKGGLIEPEHLPPTLRHAGKAFAYRKSQRRGLSPDDVDRALGEAGGNKVRAARLLGVSRATLYRFLESQETDQSG